MYLGKIRFKEDGFCFYAQLPGRKIRYRREADYFRVEAYIDRKFVSQGTGTFLFEAEVMQLRNYNWKLSYGSNDLW